VTIIMIVIARPASNLCCLPIHQRHNRVVRNPAAFHAVVINDVSKPLFTHVESGCAEYINIRRPTNKLSPPMSGLEPMALTGSFVRLRSSNPTAR